ncbi:MAG: hypothetical protein Q4A15_04560 [Prevotellaceae bacterium]|nr:hypothetical protein [Prevotellaceae bacterium]
MKWHTMDEEPRCCGVILYSEKANRIYDASYIGEGKFEVESLTVDKSHFDLWYQRWDFFNDSGLRKVMEK